MLAVGVAIGWLLHDPARMIPVLVSVLVVTCPCALSLATPAAMTAALGALARAGLIATRATAVERLALATHCLADKTGTLTEGRFRLQSVTMFTDIAESRCLALAAALEGYATHPAATTIVAAASEAGAGDEEPVVGEMDAAGAAGQERVIGHTNAAESVPSHADRAALKVEEPGTHTSGVTGRIDGIRYAVGSPEFVARTCGMDPAAFGVDGSGNDTSASSPRGRTPETAEPAAVSAGIGAPGPSVFRSDENDDGATHVFLAREGALLARFVLADTLRADASTLVEGLRRRGIETTIASGDSPAAVERAARDLGSACPSARSQWPRTRSASAAVRRRTPETDRDGNPSAPHRNLHRRRHRDRRNLPVGGPLGPVRRPRHAGGQNPARRRRIAAARLNGNSGVTSRPWEPASNREVGEPTPWLPRRRWGNS